LEVTVQKSSWKKNTACAAENDREITEVFVRLAEEQNLKSREFSPMNSKNEELQGVVFAVNTMQVIPTSSNEASIL